MGIFIRDFRNSDVQDLVKLMIELGYPTSDDEMQSRMKIIINNNDYKTIVAVDNEKIVGVIGLIKLNFWENNGCYIKVQVLIVDKLYRETGVGTKLILEAEQWAIKMRAKLISLNARNSEKRTDAHKFYPKVGFEHTSSGYIKYLPLKD